MYKVSTHWQLVRRVKRVLIKFFLLDIMFNFTYGGSDLCLSRKFKPWIWCRSSTDPKLYPNFDVSFKIRVLTGFSRDQTRVAMSWLLFVFQIAVRCNNLFLNRNFFYNKISRQCLMSLILVSLIYNHFLKLCFRPTNRVIQLLISSLKKNQPIKNLKTVK